MAHLTKQLGNETRYAYVSIRTNTADVNTDFVIWSPESNLDRKIMGFSGDAVKEFAYLAVSDEITDVRYLSLNGNDLSDWYVSEDTVTRDAAYLDKIREVRDKLLSESDKYLISDYPIDAAIVQEWIDYRQLLRDLPTSSGLNLSNPVYPTKPSMP